jgi:hypothetical protein
VLLSIGTIATTVFGKQIASGLSNAGTNLLNLFKGPGRI